MEDPMKTIQQHINLLGELPAAQTKFRADLSKKIERIQDEAGKLGDLLDKINQLKTLNARSGRDIDTVRKGYQDEIEQLKEAAKQSEKANADKLKGIAENLSKHTSSLNEIKDATDGINLDDLEKNVKALQDALNAEVQLPVQKDASTGNRWSAVRDNVEGSISGTTGTPVTNIGNLPSGWRAAKNLQQGHADHGKTYYFKDDDPDKTTYNFSDTWNKYTTDDGTTAYQHPDTKETSYNPQPEIVSSPPSSGGGRKSRPNINMRRKGGRRTRRRRTHRRRGGFRYDMSPREQKSSRTLKSVKSLRSKSVKKSKKTTRKNTGRRSTRRRRRKRRKR